MLALFSGISPLISSRKRTLSPPPSPSPFIGSTAYRLSAIRCFPFLAAKHAPSYRQRKRSLGFARDDDTGNVLSSFLLPCIGYSSRRPSFRAQREIFFVPLFHDSFAMPFTGSTVPPFLRYGVSHSLLSNTRRLAANEKDRGLRSG